MEIDCRVPDGPRRRRRLRQLRKAIETSYDTTLQIVPLQGLCIELLRVANVDTLLDRLPAVQYRPDERLPYWADLWPSSLALARYLWESVDIQGLQVLELGCGLGLAGIVASRKGAYVTFTDYEADALSFTRYNALHNDCREVAVRHLDWHTPQLKDTYDLVIASDLFYERANFRPLLHLLQLALNPAGRFLLAEPNRPIGRDFFRMLRDDGWQYQRSTSRLTVDGEEYAVSIYQGQRRSTLREVGAEAAGHPARTRQPSTR